MGGGGGYGENKGGTNREDTIGGGCGRGLCPLPHTTGYGGALEAPPSGSGAEPQKLCKIAYQNHHLFYKFFNFARINHH